MGWSAWKATKHEPEVFKRFGSILAKRMTEVCFTLIQRGSKTLLQNNCTALNSVVDKISFLSLNLWQIHVALLFLHFLLYSSSNLRISQGLIDFHVSKFKIRLKNVEMHA